MGRYTVGIVGLGSPTSPHSACFEDFARGIASALRTLGHEVVPPTDPKPGRLIIFGGNLLLNVNDKPYGRDAIIYNAEQISAARIPEQFHESFKQFKHNVVWDYSEANLPRLGELGIERPVLCPVGYVPSMTKIESAEEDIDVLHYGSTNPRRLLVLRGLQAAGLKVVQLFGVYGAERDAAIARAKVVLNLHFYLNPVFEIFRVSHLLANRKCVVAEDGGQDATLEAFAAKATALAPYEELIETCRILVADKVARQTIAEQGHEEFKKIDLVENVRKALEASQCDADLHCYA